ncbi:MAG: hypothetical protein K0Q59_5926 [Paenibacillus sp.]|nr:hypothetical protein [Paenibacillus sp.]
MSQAILNTARIVRGKALHQISAIPEELFDIQPPSFNNTIRWNVGHIVTTLEGLLNRGGVALNSNLPESYRPLFTGKSKPSEWTIAPPSKEELVNYLSRQLQAISEFPAETLDNKFEPPIQLGSMSFGTAGELFNFGFVHETMHGEAIKYILKAIHHMQTQAQV